ncbi:hypothetical protein [Agromyces sp. Soil535]|uniref:hypothetical protein n=1 Tax=Agromyces sp. Soil535 TaxID=1736390 RepID=UPI0006FD028F|nr:hypothetical protein [Agromyces sp. Soil535]KRE31191.1 hypothetical protein ASG80_01635 [Agromyces sp. Soil535]
MQVTRGSRWRAAASVAVALAFAAGSLGLGGCASGRSPGSSALPPVIVDLDDVDGTTVEVTEGGSIDLTGDDETFTEWTADIADPEVVEFVPGSDDGSAQFNPGLTAESVGETEVTLENGETGDTVTFTVEVVPEAPTGY